MICRRCDRGNRFCGASCSSPRRKKTLRRANARYQKTPRGARKHAARQARYRARKIEARKKVTHQAPADRAEAGELSGARKEGEAHETSTPILNPLSLPLSSPLSSVARTLVLAAKGLVTSTGGDAEIPRDTSHLGLRPCCVCARLCGPRVRSDTFAVSRPGDRRPRKRRPP